MEIKTSQIIISNNFTATVHALVCFLSFIFQCLDGEIDGEICFTI